MKKQLIELENLISKMGMPGRSGGAREGAGRPSGQISESDVKRGTRNIASSEYKTIINELKPKLKELGVDFKELKNNSWGYKYGKGTFSDMVEFHINENKYLPKGFYWSGQGHSVAEAKWKGWREFSAGIESGSVKLVKPK